MSEYTFPHRGSWAPARHAVLARLEERPATRPQLQAELGLSENGAHRALRRLLKSQCIRVRGEVRTPHGQRAPLYEVVP